MAPTSDIAVSETETVPEPKIAVSRMNSAQHGTVAPTALVSMLSALRTAQPLRQCHANSVEQCTVNYSRPLGWIL